MINGPQFWIVAGPNGAGKSTLARYLLPALGLSEYAAILNPDGVMRALHLGFGRPQMPTLGRLLPKRAQSYIRRQYLLAMNWAAVEAVEAVVRSSIEQRHDVCVETVLSTGKYLHHVRRAREQGFMVGMIFVALKTPAVHAERVAIRVAAGGHDVPREKIALRWERSHQQLAAFAPHLERLLVYSNDEEEPKLVAEKADGRFVIHDATRLPRTTEALSSANK